jgi:hypothetical protein
VGATDAKRFRWAYDKFMATEAAQDDARKLSRDVRSAVPHGLFVCLCVCRCTAQHCVRVRA